MNSDQLIFMNPENKELMDSVSVASQSLRNPYIDMYHWVKGEIYDIEAMRNACKSRSDILEKLRSLESKKISTQKDLADVSAGKTTVTTLFKN